jgi:hypothetical protein
MSRSDLEGNRTVKQRSIRHLAARAAVVGTVVAALAGSYGAAAAGASTLGGTATITDPGNAQAPLPSGAAAKVFSVVLPNLAACPGDSQSGGYRVQSYLVHSGTDVSTLKFTGGQPSAGYGLLDTGGSYYGPANTAPTTGQIIGIPNNFQWSQLTASGGFGLPLATILYSGTSGVWETGIACADTNGNVTDYWNSEVTFTASGADPSGFTWAAVPGVSAGTPEVPLPILLPVIGLAVVGGSIALGRRRNRRPTLSTVTT